jgi:two-component system chemotaxis response regulator CheB
MGCDGLQGCQKIYEAGGQIMAQDQESSVVWGMPGFVAKEGLASVVAPLPRLAEEVSNRLMIATHRRIDPKNRK